MEYVVGKPVTFTVGEYTVKRDQYGNWTRTVPIHERTHPKGFSEYALTQFEIALVEAYWKVNQGCT